MVIMFKSRGRKLFLKENEFHEFQFDISQVLENKKYVIVLGKNQEIQYSLKSRKFKEITIKASKALFHPFSSKVVLFLGYKLFVYNLGIEKVESDYALTGISNLSFSAYSSPVNFIIKDFTVYILYEDAVVESLCPVAPREFYIAFRKIMLLKSKIEQSGGYWAKEWIKDLFKQVKSSVEEEEKLLSDQVLVVNPKVQGKTGLEKVEIDFVKCPCVDSTVSDIYSSDFKIEKEELELFFTSGRDGVLHLFLQDIPMTPYFKADKKENKPKWILLEKISLFQEENQDTFVNFVGDPKYSNVVYAYHDYGVHRIDFAVWKEVISKYYKNLQDLETIISDCHSNVEWIMTTFKGEVDPVYELKIFSDFEFGYSYKVTTKLGKKFHDILPIRPIKKSFSRTQVNERVAASKELFKIPTIPKLGLSTFKSVGKYPDGISEILLTDFTQEIVRQRNHLTSLLQAGVVLQARLNYILQEHEEAKKVVSAASLLSSSNYSEDFELRLNAISKRHKKLESKSGIILQILLDQTQPELNSAEHEWFLNLKKLAISIKKKFSLAIDDVINRGITFR